MIDRPWFSEAARWVAVFGVLELAENFAGMRDELRCKGVKVSEEAMVLVRIVSNISTYLIHNAFILRCFCVL